MFLKIMSIWLNLRAEKVARVVNEIPDLVVYGKESGDLLLVGWGGSYGYLITAVREFRPRGIR